jgi:hypothetical protein
LPQGFHAPLRSALRVWLPSRRLTPSEPVSVLFRTDSAPGIHPSECSPLARYPTVPGRKNPLAVFPAVTVAAETATRLGRPRLLGFYPCESPWRAECAVNASTAGYSLGFLPFQGPPATALSGLLPGLLSRTSPSDPQADDSGGTSEYQSALAWPYPHASGEPTAFGARRPS